MLISCPECGKQISDKSEKCIHCGFPLVNINKSICTINGKVYDFSEILSNIENDLAPALCIREISDMCSIPIYEAGGIYSKIKKDRILPEVINCDSKEQLSIPKCPTCGSANIQKICGVERSTSIMVLGIFSSKINKTYKCKDCGYKW